MSERRRGGWRYIAAFIVIVAAVGLPSWHPNRVEPPSVPRLPIPALTAAPGCFDR